MGAHSTPGHHPARTVTATVGVAAALVTTATTGLLTGGTALASDGSGGSGGHGHSHGHSHRYQDESSYQGDDSADTIASQTLCDVLGDVPLGVGVSCPGGSSGDDSSSGQDQESGSSSGVQDASVQQASASTAPAAPKPAAPAPAPRPTSAVPATPQLLKIS